MEYAVICENLKKSYGKVKAVRGISFKIKTGEVYGFLGPNGAGKTTTLEIFEGLRRADAGKVTILGKDAFREQKAIKDRLGVQLQTTALDDKIKVGESIKLFGKFYSRQADYDWLIDLVSLREKENALYQNLSGGQKQRLAVALALVNEPDLVFLDEPTTGLDPQARRNLWAVIEKMRRMNKTIILTTHYMEEAENLCDRVAIIDNGKIIAEDTPENLITSLNLNCSIAFTTGEKIEIAKLERLKGVQKAFSENGQYLVHCNDLQSSLVALLQMAEKSSLKMEQLKVTKATLEDVFLELTGRRLRD